MERTDMKSYFSSPSEQLLSRKAVAHRWQTSVETVKRREKAGLLKPIRFNQRLLRYKLSDIEALEAAAAGGGQQ
jgi:predicted site-specific integrase-resolvase